MSWAIGPVLFFPVYLGSVSLAGGLALIAVGAAIAIKLTRSGPAWPVLAAAALGALPFLVMK